MRLLFALTAVLLTIPSAGAYDRGLLAEYNDLYKSGDYRAALDGYLEMTVREPGNPYAFYNTGNAWYRLNKPGQATLYYARAFRLLPRDADIRANLDLAMKQSGQALVPEGTPRVLHYLYYLFSDAELKTAAIFFWWLACLLLGLYFLRHGLRPRLRGPAAASAALLACSLLWLGARTASPFNGAAVITAEGSVQLLSGPGDSFKAYASLPEARLIRILDSSDDSYYEIGIPREGIKGWIKKTAAEKI